jgi:hypothetical protein
MTKNRNEALEAVTAPKAVPAEIVTLPAKPPKASTPKAPDDVVRVMLYLPHRVKRVFDEMGHSAERRAHDFYVAAIEQYQRANGHGKAADLLIRR